MPTCATLRNSLTSVVLPAWVKRCGERCGETYNRLVAPITGVKYEPSRHAMLGGLIAAASFCRRAVARLGTLMGYVAGWGFILCAAFITFDVIARRFFGFSSQATTELTGYALAFGISWALAHALTTRAHIRIDVLINHLPDRLRYPMHLLSLAALARVHRLHRQGRLRPGR